MPRLLFYIVNRVTTFINYESVYYYFADDEEGEEVVIRDENMEVPVPEDTGFIPLGRRQRAPVYNWTEEDGKPALPVFQEDSGVKAEINSDSSVFDCFSLFFDLAMIKIIKTETNRYAATSIAEMRRTGTLKPNSTWQTWTTVKLFELYYFFGIIFHMCLVKLPKLSDYWSNDPVIQTAFARKLLSRDRFFQILNMLHINNNDTFVPRNQPGHDPLHKIRPFFDFLIQKCRSCFYPGQNLTIDEGMCPFRGRLSFRVYMKNKPHKYGIKFYIVADARTGYVVNIQMYSGRELNKDNSIPTLVRQLCDNLLGKGHVIYMDRFYTSPALFDDLWKEHTVAVGTVMKNRKGLPKDLINMKLRRGEFSFRRSEHLFFLKWRDTRDVYMLSTAHDVAASLVKTKSRFGTIDKVKPDIVLDYNVNKTGVDHGDQLLSYYPFHRKTIKWWKKVFFHLITVGVVNSFILYKETRSDNKIYHLNDYVKKLSIAFAEHGGKEFQNQPLSPTSSVNRLSGRHFPKQIPPTENKENPTRICKVCSDKSLKETGKRKRRETRWYCESCNIPLCASGCFTLYHTKSTFC